MKKIFTAILLLIPVFANAAIEVPADALYANGGLKRALTESELRPILKSLNLPWNKNNANIVETAIRMSGKNYQQLTVDDITRLMKTKGFNGYLLETEIAKSDPHMIYTKNNNASTDLVCKEPTSKGAKIRFIQAKSYKGSVTGLREGMYDALSHVGKVNSKKAIDFRMENLRSGKHSFEIHMPKDKYNELVEKGFVNKNGTLTRKGIKLIPEEQFAKEMGKAGKNAECLRNIKNNGIKYKDVLKLIKIKPTSSSYSELHSIIKTLQTVKIALSGGGNPKRNAVSLNQGSTSSLTTWDPRKPLPHIPGIPKMVPPTGHPYPFPMSTNQTHPMPYTTSLRPIPFPVPTTLDNPSPRPAPFPWQPMQKAQTTYIPQYPIPTKQFPPILKTPSPLQPMPKHVAVQNAGKTFPKIRLAANTVMKYAPVAAAPASIMGANYGLNGITQAELDGEIDSEEAFFQRNNIIFKAMVESGSAVAFTLTCKLPHVSIPILAGAMILDMNSERIVRLNQTEASKQAYQELRDEIGYRVLEAWGAEIPPEYISDKIVRESYINAVNQTRNRQLEGGEAMYSPQENAFSFEVQ